MSSEDKYQAPSEAGVMTSTYSTPLGKFTCRADDHVVRRAYELSGGWDLNETTFLCDQAFPEGRGALIDAGAHIGMVSIPAVRKHTGVICHAFEPHPMTAWFLRHNAAQNDVAERYHVHELALVDEVMPEPVGARGKCRVERTFYPSDADSVDGRLEKDPGAPGAFGEERRTRRYVEVSTLERELDADKLQHPLVLKIDVQGMEAAVLRGALYLDPDIVLMEVWPYGLARAGETVETVT